MKKFLKNTLLAVLTICFILNIVNTIKLVVEHYIITPQIAETAEQISNMQLSKEETYQQLASFYVAGQGNKIAIQVGILGLSLMVGVIIGLIVTFEKKSKIKFILVYIAGLLMMSIIMTLFCMTPDMRFLIELLYNVHVIWKWYTVIFAVVYIIRIYIDNKNTQKLNEILKNRKYSS